MSTEGFVGAAAMVTIHAPHEAQYAGAMDYLAFAEVRERLNSVAAMGYRAGPLSGECDFAGAMGSDMMTLACPGHVRRDAFLRGQAWRLGLRGVTRDAYGTRLGFCSVKLFVTSSDQRTDSVTSDDQGNYVVTSPYDANHYAVVYKSGSPDVFGTTRNTLRPS